MSKSLLASKSLKNLYQRMQIIDILLKYILWYNFLNNLDAQRDFDKNFVTKKPVKWNYSYLKYALAISNFWNDFFIFQKYRTKNFLIKYISNDAIRRWHWDKIGCIPIFYKFASLQPSSDKDIMSNRWRKWVRIQMKIQSSLLIPGTSNSRIS